MHPVPWSPTAVLSTGIYVPRVSVPIPTVISTHSICTTTPGQYHSGRGRGRGGGQGQAHGTGPGYRGTGTGHGAGDWGREHWAGHGARGLGLGPRQMHGAGTGAESDGIIFGHGRWAGSVRLRGSWPTGPQTR